ncbi:hypothetical protein B0H13DRAFT_2120491 [Mycena leptocephala]|nr:hypothetical protein B0H13DRAFT_2120491 [Mycena leptocephala]
MSRRRRLSGWMHEARNRHARCSGCVRARRAYYGYRRACSARAHPLLARTASLDAELSWASHSGNASTPPSTAKSGINNSVLLAPHTTSESTHVLAFDAKTRHRTPSTNACSSSVTSPRTLSAAYILENTLPRGLDLHLLQERMQRTRCSRSLSATSSRKQHNKSNQAPRHRGAITRQQTPPPRYGAAPRFASPPTKLARRSWVYTANTTGLPYDIGRRDA